MARRRRAQEAHGHERALSFFIIQFDLIYHIELAHQHLINGQNIKGGAGVMHECKRPPAICAFLKVKGYL